MNTFLGKAGTPNIAAPGGPMNAKRRSDPGNGLSTGSDDRI